MSQGHSGQPSHSRGLGAGRLEAVPTQMGQGQVSGAVGRLCMQGGSHGGAEAAGRVKNSVVLRSTQILASAVQARFLSSLSLSFLRWQMENEIRRRTQPGLQLRA